MSLFKRAKIVPKAGAPTLGKELTAGEKRQLAITGMTLKILTRRWFDGILTVEANRILPGLLLTIFENEKLGREVSKTEACEPFGIDPTKTGARYIAMAQEHGLLTIERKSRKDVLRLTETGRALVEQELASLADLFPEANAAIPPAEVIFESQNKISGSEAQQVPRGIARAPETPSGQSQDSTETIKSLARDQAEEMQSVIVDARDVVEGLSDLIESAPRDQMASLDRAIVDARQILAAYEKAAGHFSDAEKTGDRRQFVLGARAYQEGQQMQGQLSEAKRILSSIASAVLGANAPVGEAQPRKPTRQQRLT